MFKKRDNIKEVEEGKYLAPKFDKNGLIPVITTDFQTGDILMHGYMNNKALKKTIERKEAYYWSRSRNKIWHKGQISGFVQKVKEIRVDDDLHTIWIDDKEMVYEVPADKRPKMVIFNAGMRIPCKLTFNKSISEWILQLEKGPHILDRIAAAKELSTKKGRHIVESALLNAAKNDPFWGVRKDAVNAFAKLKSKKY